LLTTLWVEAVAVERLVLGMHCERQETMSVWHGGQAGWTSARDDFLPGQKQ
jgi:hypothetical protein